MNGDTPTPDLRFHNQHLHGWGVVSGLQLRFCGKDEGGPGDVALEAGYAIDPTGKDIRVAKRTTVPLANLVQAAGLALKDVQVSVILQRDGTVALERYEADSTWDRLQGTMLRDLLDEQLAPLWGFIQEEVLARPGRITTFLNLLAPLWNPRWGGAVLPAEGPDHDDAVLRASFDKLRELLSKKTFSGMYEGLRFPSYDVLKSLAPADIPRPETIFGNALDDKLRVGPGGNLLYTFGSGNVIRVYDHDQRKMIQELTFPAADAVVQDLAFSRSGTTVYVTALLGKDKAASLFSVVTVDGAGRHAFRPGAVTVCAVPFVTLETSAHVDGRVFAIARGPAASGGGLYVIDPTNVNPTPTAAVPFNAVGPFTVADRESGAAFGYACASSGTTATSTYDRVVRIDLQSPGSGAAVYKLPSTGSDDLCTARDDRAGLHALFVVVNGPQGSKQLAKLDDEDADSEPSLIDLSERTAIRLAYGPLTKRVFVTYEDQGQGRVLNPFTDALSTDPHPLQLGPVAVRAAKKGERWLALNFFSRTLTTIPAQWTSADGAAQLEESVIDRSRLIAYRHAALQAFIGLAGRLLQYLKDSAADRFQLDAPQDVGQQLYLGAVSFKDGKVWQICGLDRRRYVRSFPSVEYWMSLLPVLPALSLALEKLGAWALPALFDRLGAATRPDGQTLLETSTARAAYQTAQGLGLRSLAAARLGRWIGVKQVASAWYAAQVERAKVGPIANTVSTEALTGSTVPDAEAKAAALGLLVVSARKLDPVSDPLGSLSAAMASFRIIPGSAVELVTDGRGVVRYVRPVAGGAADLGAVAALRKSHQEVSARAAAASDQASSIDQELEVMKLSSLDREAKLTRLTNKLTDVAEDSDRRGKEISELRSTVNDLRKELARMGKELTQLRERLR